MFTSNLLRLVTETYRSIPYRLFGTNPAKASAFDSVLILINADALAGIAMIAWALASNSLDALMNAEAFAGFVPKSPCGFLEAFP